MPAYICNPLLSRYVSFNTDYHAVESYSFDRCNQCRFQQLGTEFPFWSCTANTKIEKRCHRLAEPKQVDVVAHVLAVDLISDLI